MTPDNKLAGFEQGYVCAVATLLKQHGDTVAATDMMHALGPVDWRNIDAYDRQAFKDAGLKLSDFCGAPSAHGEAIGASEGVPELEPDLHLLK